MRYSMGGANVSGCPFETGSLWWRESPAPFALLAIQTSGPARPSRSTAGSGLWPIRGCGSDESARKRERPYFPTAGCLPQRMACWGCAITLARATLLTSPIREMEGGEWS